jgi:hypothetical protein
VSDAIMHLFKCVICDMPMAGTGRSENGRCTYCETVFSGVSTSQARQELELATKTWIENKLRAACAKTGKDE